jgi:glucokinase
LPPADAPALAVDVGGTYTRLAMVARGAVLDESYREFRTADFHGGDDLVDAIADAGRAHSSASVGVCVPALLDHDLTTPEYCPNTPAIEGYPLRARLSERLRRPVRLEVDCNAAALAEYHYGAARGVARLVVMSLGTGVGVGVLDRGRPLRPTGGCFGDLGHIHTGGARRCSAGCLGCLESNVSVAALGPDPKSVRALLDAARRGEPAAVDTLAAAGRAIGIALASMSSFLRPNLVLLAGGISEAGDFLLAAANETFRAYAAAYFLCPLRKSALGPRAALIGASALEEAPK